jgi:two-component system, cell cycle response regulator DivK
LDPTHQAHAAFLYESSDAYFDHVVGIVDEGTRVGERVALIPLGTRWQELAARLNAAGIDWVRAAQRRDLVIIPAETFVEATVVDAMFDPRRFDETVQQLLSKRGLPRRMYGDAAALLVSQDNLAAAVALEHAWSNILRDQPVLLSCGYDLSLFPDDEPDWPVRTVINGHRHAALERGTARGHLLPAAADTREDDPPLVLLWDDHHDTRAMYAEALTFSGYRVIVADDATQTIALAEAYHPGLILMDVRLGRPRAAAAMRLLRTRHVYSGPILALTAHAFSGERAEIFGDGFDAVLSKPCLPDELVGHVTRALHEREP